MTGSGLFDDPAPTAEKTAHKAPRVKPGFYLLHRGWMDNPAFLGSREPFCRRAAWIWLIENAAWKDTKIDIQGAVAVVSRGQISASYRTLAKTWNWAPAVVQRFIDRLKTDTMIETSIGTGRLLITICNYDRYQGVRDDAGTPSGTADGTGAVHQRYTGGTQKKEGNKLTKEEGIESSTLSSDEPAAEAPDPLPIERPQSELLPSAKVITMPNIAAEAVLAWNTLALDCGLPQVTKLTETRRRSLLARLRDCKGLDGWKAYLDLVRARPFLLGDNSSKWRADFDFVIRSEKFTRIMEGAYSGSSKKPAINSRLDHIPIAPRMEQLLRRQSNAAHAYDIDGEVS